MRRHRLIATLVAAVAAIGGLGLLKAQQGHDEVAHAGPSARADGALVVGLVTERPGGPTHGALDHRLDRFGAVAPDWARLRPDGLFDYTAIEPRLVALQSRGARLLPVVHDPDLAIGEVLANREARDRLAARLAAALQALGADGVVLDMDEVPIAGRTAYPELVRDLRRRLGEEATIVVVAPSAAATGAARGYDLRDLARPALVLVEAWGEHGPSTAPGPVASLEWFRTVVRAAVHAAPRSRILLGIPTWGYRWTDEGVVTVAQAETYPVLSEPLRAAEDGAPLTVGGDEAWTETDRSIELKLRVARAAGVAGVGLELIGGESTHLWNMPLLAPASPGPGG
jgi:spore germination protein YaaH